MTNFRNLNLPVANFTLDLLTYLRRDSLEALYPVLVILMWKLAVYILFMEGWGIAEKWVSPKSRRNEE